MGARITLAVFLVAAGMGLATINGIEHSAGVLDLGGVLIASALSSRGDCPDEPFRQSFRWTLLGAPGLAAPTPRVHHPPSTSGRG